MIHEMYQSENNYVRESQRIPDSMIDENVESPQKRDLSGYEVVREDYFSDSERVQLNFNKGRIYINSYGLSRFPDEDYVRILVNDEMKSLVIKPYKERVRASFRWCGGRDKRKPRHVKCLPLFYLIYKTMKWDINARYRITGEIEEANGERVIYFDLKEAVCFGPDTHYMQMPKEWEKHYGMPVMDFENRQDIKTFQDMAIFDVEFETSKENLDRMKKTVEEKAGGTDEE